MLPSLRTATLAALTALLTISGAALADKPAPDFTLKTLDGPNLRLGEQRGQVVMVNFWASWCGPCKQEMPHLNRLHDKYKNSGFKMLGVNIDDDPKKAASAAASLGVKFPVLLDAAKDVSRLYGLSAMPTTFVIDRDGRLRHVHRGYREGYENLYEQQVRALVKE